MQNILTRISLKTLPLLLISLTLLLGFCVTGIAQKATESALTSTPLPLDKMNSIRFDTNLSDQQKVLALIHILDQRISQAPIPDPTGNKPAPAHEYSYIIRYIAAHNDDTKASRNGRIHAIETVISQLNTLQDITHKDEVRTYLYIALASAGGNAPEDVLLSLLNNPDSPTDILNAVLIAMQYSTVPIHSLPRLLELTEHPYNYVFLNDLGTPNPRRIYPIREAALADLTQLGIQAKAVSIKDEKVDPGWKARLSTTVIEIDRKSLVAKLREWLSSDDPKIWRPAAEVIHQIPGDDIKTMLTNFLKQNKLSDEKKQVLTRE